MGEIINLRQARKTRARAERLRKAGENRAKFGRPRHEREQAKSAMELEQRRLEGAKRSRDEDKRDA
jgi:hypothetical protein